MRNKFVTILFVPFMTKNIKAFFLLMFLNAMFIKSHVTKKLREKIIFFLQSFVNTHTGLPANIRLGLKWQTVPNALAYYDTELITTVKGFVKLAQLVQWQRQNKFINIGTSTGSWLWGLESLPRKTFWVAGLVSSGLDSIGSPLWSPSVVAWVPALKRVRNIRWIRFLIWKMNQMK